MVMVFPSGPGYSLRRDVGTAGLGRSISPGWRGDHAEPPLLLRNGKGAAPGFLGGACGVLGGSCGRPELPRRAAREALEVLSELALVREAGIRGALRQGEVAASQERPGPLDAAGRAASRWEDDGTRRVGGPVRRLSGEGAWS